MENSNSSRIVRKEILPVFLNRGSDSREAKIQASQDTGRKSTSSLYYPTPSEPLEMTVDYDDSRVPIIPLEDITTETPPVQNIPHLPTINNNPMNINNNNFSFINSNNNMNNVTNNMNFRPNIDINAIPNFNTAPFLPSVPAVDFALLNNLINQTRNNSAPTINNDNYDDDKRCKFYSSPGGCKRGNQCEFRHM